MPAHIDTDNKDSVYSFRSVDACYLECFVCMCLLLLLFIWFSLEELHVCNPFLFRLKNICFCGSGFHIVQLMSTTKNHACLQFARRISASADHVFMS